VVVKEKVLALGDDSDDLLQVYQFTFLLILHVEVYGVDGDLHLTLLLTPHAVVT
jgi:hypothetical protein